VLKILLVCSVASCVLLGASPSLAADAPDNDGVGATAVDEIVVTPAREPVARNRVGAAVTVLDQQAINDSQAIAVSDLIAQTPGVSFSRNGGYGTTTQVRIRGAETDQTVLVVDGVKLNDPASAGGGFNFGDLLVGDTARIEILRGPQSILWGSQAIGGVVALTTVQPQKSLEASLQAEGGSLDTGLVKGGVGGVSDHVTWRLAGQIFTTEGISAYHPGTERDGDHSAGASATAVIRLTDALSVDLRGLYGDNHFDFDKTTADSRDQGRSREELAYGGVNLDLFGGRLKNRLAGTYTDNDRYQFNPTQANTPTTFDSNGANVRWEYQGVWAIAEGWNATFGAEDERQAMRTRSPTAGAPNPAFVTGHAQIDSLYAQVTGELAKGVTLSGGLRQDDHSTFGAHMVGQAALAWSLNDGTTVLRTSYGQGFKAPTLYQLYSDNSNPALQPETANSWDAGVEQTLFGGRLALEATYFHRDNHNQIEFVSCPNVNPLCTAGPSTRLGFYQNLTRTRAQGIEFAATAKLTQRLTLDANYTWTDAVNQTPGASFDKRLARRPENTGEVWATYAWPSGLKTAVAARLVGAAFDTIANTFVLKSYTVIDLRVSYPVTDKVELYGRVENATDEIYETARNFGAPRRGVFAGVRARF
jgi:vitamin B12 transporter